MPTSGIKQADRRKNKRYMVRDNVFAVFRSSPNASSLANIVDISRGGFAFKLVGMEDISNDCFELDIFVSGDGRCLGNIPFKIISETSKEKERRLFHIAKRRVGARFDKLTNVKMMQIDRFINSHKIMDNLPDTPA